MPFLSSQEAYALALTTFAGLSTCIGAGFAIVRQPDDALLALLLGNAMGVMLLLSVWEMWLHNAMEHGWPEITIAFALGALIYQLIQPFIPEFGSQHSEAGQAHPSELEKSWFDDSHKPHSLPGVSSPGRADRVERQDSSNSSSQAERRPRSSERLGSGGLASAELLADGSTNGKRELHFGGSGSSGSANGAINGAGSSKAAAARMRPRQLLRLGLLMAVTMTLHNLPEGFAVAFAAFTDFGPVMALAISIHNIPEGVIVAAPMYAATGSRWKALGLATASGLSEPLGALLALLLVKPFLTETRLHYILGFVGGLMAAVSLLELWPEAKRCRNDQRMWMGIILGVVIMGATLLYV
jgi:ZIP family zinc transporter